MKAMRGILTLGSLGLLPALTSATITFDVSTKYPEPRVNTQTPAVKYLSGTKCEAKCIFIAPPGNAPLKKVELFLQGKVHGGATETTLVASWTKPANPPPGEDQEPVPPLYPMHTLKVKFAATHFQHLTDLTLIGKAKDELDQLHEATFTDAKKIYNTGMVYEHPDFYFGGSGGISANFSLQKMNHSTADRLRYGSGWTRGEFLDDVYGATAGHIGTHGSSAGLFDTLGVLIESTYIRQNCWNAVNSANGYPAVNLFFFDACNIGQSNVASSILCTPDMNTVNRAVVGFNVLLHSKGSPALGTAFWGALEKGLVAGSALSRAVRDYNAVALAKGFPELKAGDYVLTGDSHARLWQLYTGSAKFAPKIWFKEVSP